MRNFDVASRWVYFGPLISTRRADGGGLRGGEGGGAAAVGLRNLTFFEFEYRI